MKRPEVSIHNLDEVYRYYETCQPNPRLAKLAHLTMSALMRTDVVYPESSKTVISSLLEDNTRLIIAGNHLTYYDQFTLGAMVQQEETLHPLRGNTFVLAKEPLFNSRIPILRRTIDALGAVPVFREKDIETDTRLVSPDKRVALRYEAGRRIIRLATQKIKAGSHMAIFPEGTRNTQNLQQILPLKPGIGAIATAASHDVDVAVVPVGMWYRDASRSVPRHVTVYIGNPFQISGDNPRSITNKLQCELQECVDRAASIQDDTPDKEKVLT